MLSPLMVTNANAVAATLVVLMYTLIMASYDATADAEPICKATLTTARREPPAPAPETHRTLEALLHSLASHAVRERRARGLSSTWLMCDPLTLITVEAVTGTLIATKVTDDKNVPKGEMSFSVDLSPFALSNNLEPIELGREASQQWGCKFLPRFSGNGQVANEGFVNSQVVEGQLIMVGQYFSFAWLPIQHQVFFGRPSAELTLKLLRESRGAQGHSAQWREHLARCLQETEHLEDELEVHGQFFRSHNQQDYYSLDGCFE